MLVILLCYCSIVGRRSSLFYFSLAPEDDIRCRIWTENINLISLYLRSDNSTFIHAIFQLENLHFCCCLLLKTHQSLGRQNFSSTEEPTETYMCLSIPTECKPAYIWTVFLRFTSMLRSQELEKCLLCPFTLAWPF